MYGAFGKITYYRVQREYLFEMRYPLADEGISGCCRTEISYKW